MNDFRPLTLSDCPLLADQKNIAELIDLFNQVNQEFQNVAQGDYRSVLDRDDGRKYVDRFRDVRDRLTRTHYRVGFLGTSSAGKSTIFNLVLQDKIAESGAGDATTSLPSRLRYQAGPPTCLLSYMTANDYKDRLEKLCKELGIGTVPSSMDELLKQLTELHASNGGSVGGRIIREHDVDYLRAFIKSEQLFGNKLGSPPKSVPFEKRSDYINHQDQRQAQQGSENLLLIEAQLSIENRYLPARLELCDLPGLNSKRTVDNIITQDYLNQLDGALLFVNVADNLQNQVLIDTISQFSRHYGGDLAGRAWVVFNKCDTLTEDHYFPSPDRRSVFGNIQELLSRSKVPLSQVCFTSRKLIDAAKGQTLDQSEAARLLSLPSNEPRPRTVPPEMEGIWNDLLKDGGVSRLRHIMLREMADSVAEKIRSAARQDLSKLLEDLKHLVEGEKRRRTGGAALRSKATQCRNTIVRLQENLGGRATDFPSLAEVRGYLRQEMSRLLCESPDHAAIIKGFSTQKLQQQFKIDSKNLEKKLCDLLATEVVDKIYAKVGEHLESLPPVPIGRHEKLQDAWQDYRREDRSSLDWFKAMIPSFHSEELLQNPASQKSFQRFDGDIYLELMGDKVRVAVGQVVHGLRSQLRHRLSEIEKYLDQLLLEDHPSA